MSVVVKTSSGQFSASPGGSALHSNRHPSAARGVEKNTYGMHTPLTFHLHCLKLQPDGPEGQYLCRMTNAQAFCGPSGRYINSFLTRYRPSGPDYNLVLEKSYKDIGPLGHGVKTWTCVNEVLELFAYRRVLRPRTCFKLQ